MKIVVLLTLAACFAVLAVVFTAGPAAAQTAPCTTSSPASNAYTVTVYLTQPPEGGVAKGAYSVSATATITGTSTGLLELNFYLGGKHIINDRAGRYVLL